MLRILLIAALLVTIACTAAEADESAAKPPDVSGMNSCITALAWGLMTHEHTFSSARQSVGSPNRQWSLDFLAPSLKDVIKRDCAPFLDTDNILNAR